MTHTNSVRFWIQTKPAIIFLMPTSSHISAQSFSELESESQSESSNSPFAETEVVFQTAAELFSLLSTPVRLKILSSLCDVEKNVSQMVAEIGVSQPNLSQHLAAMYKSGVLGKRRAGNQIFYRVVNQNAVAICRTVCSQIAIDLDD